MIETKQLKGSKVEQILEEKIEIQNGNVVKKKAPPPPYVPPIPFSQRLKKVKLDEQFTKFLNIFKKLEISIPFVETLA